MNTDPRSISFSRRRAARARTRIVFFLLRRGLRQFARALRRYAAIRGEGFELGTLNTGQGVIR